MDWYYTLMFSSSSLKKTCLFIYVTFYPILTSTRNFWPQTRVHRDVCISPNIFGIFLIWIWITWLFSFQMPWERSDSTLHYPCGVLYKEPLGHIEEEELKSKETIVHFCLSLLIHESASLCPFGALCVLPKLAFVGYMVYYLHVHMEGRCACQRYSLVIPKAPSTETGRRPCFHSELVIRPLPMRAQQAIFFGYL